MAWDLWVDFHRIDEHGLTLANARNARPGVRLHRGSYVVVGEEDSGDAVAKIVEFDKHDGFLRLQVLPGPASAHQDLLKGRLKHLRQALQH